MLKADYTSVFLIKSGNLNLYGNNWLQMLMWQIVSYKKCLMCEFMHLTLVLFQTNQAGIMF